MAVAYGGEGLAAEEVGLLKILEVSARRSTIEVLYTEGAIEQGEHHIHRHETAENEGHKFSPTHGDEGVVNVVPEAFRVSLYIEGAIGIHESGLRGGYPPKAQFLIERVFLYLAYQNAQVFGCHKSVLRRNG